MNVQFVTLTVTQQDAERLISLLSLVEAESPKRARRFKKQEKRDEMYTNAFVASMLRQTIETEVKINGMEL